MASRSPQLMTDQPNPESELGIPLHRQTRERFPEPLLLQFRETAGFLLLGNEAVQEIEKLGIALGNGPGRVRLAGDGLPQFKYAGFFSYHRLQVDNGVDDIIDAAKREILKGFGIRGILDDLAELSAFL